MLTYITISVPPAWINVSAAPVTPTVPSVKINSMPFNKKSVKTVWITVRLAKTVTPARNVSETSK